MNHFNILHFQKIKQVWGDKPKININKTNKSNDILHWYHAYKEKKKTLSGVYSKEKSEILKKIDIELYLVSWFGIAYKTCMLIFGGASVPFVEDRKYKHGMEVLQSCYLSSCLMTKKIKDHGHQGWSWGRGLISKIGKLFAVEGGPERVAFSSVEYRGFH